jgi:SAM-dependent methyltransferase
VAYQNIGRRPNVHLVQADIMAMPFREGTFDLAYSVGVLHHTPDPERAFGRVAAMVREGGALAVYVYARYGPSHRFSDAIRRLTTRLPLPVLRAVAALAVPAYYLYRVPVIGGPLGMVCPISRHPDWRWRWLDTFDWYSPKYQWKVLYPDAFRWFQSNGFRDIELFDGPIRIRGSKAA